MSGFSHPPLSFVLAFLLFSGIFFYNAYRLWFKTETYYQSLRESLSRDPSPYPFRAFFLRQLENRKRWELRQKAFSILGLIGVLAADALVIAAWLAD
ncbi:MAG: hypothetical protein ACM3QS_06890 [Bacteroidota bacterium]